MWVELPRHIGNCYSHKRFDEIVNDISFVNHVSYQKQITIFSYNEMIFTDTFLTSIREIS